MHEDELEGLISEAMDLYVPWMAGELDLKDALVDSRLNSLGKTFEANKAAMLKFYDDNRTNIDAYERVECLGEMICLLHGLGKYSG